MLTDHCRWKFEIEDVDATLILRQTPIGKLFHALDVLISERDDRSYLPAWQCVADEYIDIPAKTESAFKSICYILEANLKPNRNFLRQFIESNGL
jgi:hypothetical protein